MAFKVKVITPQNLGKGIKYNNETKQWESPDEYERLDGYEFPKANDTHYTEEHTTKFRHIKTGFIHEAKKVELIPRGEPIDEVMTFENTAAGFTPSSSQPADSKPTTIRWGRISGTSVYTGLSYLFDNLEWDVSQFDNAEEANKWAQGKFIKSELVPGRGFNRDKPHQKIKDTVINVPYPKIQYSDEIVRFNPNITTDSIASSIDLGRDNPFTVVAHVKAHIHNHKQDLHYYVDKDITFNPGTRNIEWREINNGVWAHSLRLNLTPLPSDNPSQRRVSGIRKKRSLINWCSPRLSNL